MNATLEHVKDTSGKLLFNLITDIPKSSIKASKNPQEKTKKLIKKAVLKSASVSATLSAPGGFAGILTAIPDIASIWKIQSQLVADIAAAYGKIAFLNREAMLWCLFRHSAAQLLRDTFVHSGTRFITQKASITALETLLKKIGVLQTQKILGKSLSRALPLFGALASGAYAAYDTNEVGKTAQTYFKALSEEYLECEESDNFI